MAEDPKPAITTALSVPPKQEPTLPAVPQEVKRDPYHGASSRPATKEQADILMAPVDKADVEIRPDGIIYLPEIKYRRTLNRAFGPMGWSLLPRSDVTMQDKTMTRLYALYVDGRFVAEARGEMDYIPANDQMTYATTAEGVKSNALMRCCKDLGIASELWDPGFIEAWKREYAAAYWVEGKNKPQWRRNDRQPFYKEGAPVEQTHAVNVPAATPKAASPFVTPKAAPAASKPVIDVPAQAMQAPSPQGNDIANFFAVVTGVKPGKGGKRKDGTAWSIWYVDYTEPNGDRPGSLATFEESVAADAADAQKDGEARLITTETANGKTKIVKITKDDKSEDIQF